jgi:hypothetical protein
MKNKTFFILSSLLVSILFMECETLDLDINQNPNAASPENADINLLLNGVQYNFTEWLGEEDADNRVGFEAGMEVVRMLNMSGPLYQNAYEPGDFDDIWRQAYSEILADINAVKTLAIESESFHHLGVVQILESYVLTTLVDYFGDIPYTEAIKGTEVIYPKLDDDQQVYDAAITLLDNAISNLKMNASAGITNDLFYDGDIDMWITTANSLKLRIFNNIRLVDPNRSKSEIESLISEDDLINSTSKDFEIQYGTQKSPVDVRHQQYIDNYIGSPSGEYMSNYFMNSLLNERAVVDPRLRYYMYRQTDTYPEPDAQGLFDLPCLGDTYPSHYSIGRDPFCIVGLGYWGRDHGNNEGLPSDSDKITTFGTYPIGGKFDDDSFTNVKEDDGLKGAGIHPILLSSYVYFIRAEAALALNTSDNPKVMLEMGIRSSIDKVVNFDPSVKGNSFATTQDDIDAYVQDVLDAYENATNDSKRMNIIIREYYVASWGNHVEAYNSYRRTGKPENLQPTLLTGTGAFIRSFKYPSVTIDVNININSKADQSVKIFWDLGNDNLDF